MITMMTKTAQDTYEELAVSPEQALERTLPAKPFPRKHIHSVFDDPQDAMQAFCTLLAAGYNARDIHILTGQEYVEALEQGQTLLGFITSIDLDDYLRESRKGRHLLTVRLSGYGQMEQVRDLLAPHQARMMKYIDTWTIANLIQ